MIQDFPFNLPMLSNLNPFTKKGICIYFTNDNGQPLRFEIYTRQWKAVEELKVEREWINNFGDQQIPGSKNSSILSNHKRDALLIQSLTGYKNEEKLELEFERNFPEKILTRLTALKKIKSNFCEVLQQVFEEAQHISDSTTFRSFCLTIWTQLCFHVFLHEPHNCGCRWMGRSISNDNYDSKIDVLNQFFADHHLRFNTDYPNNNDKANSKQYNEDKTHSRLNNNETNSLTHTDANNSNHHNEDENSMNETREKMKRGLEYISQRSYKEMLGLLFQMKKNNRGIEDVLPLFCPSSPWFWSFFAILSPL